jgi:hypothetical protein
LLEHSGYRVWVVLVLLKLLLLWLLLNIQILRLL